MILRYIGAAPIDGAMIARLNQLLGTFNNRPWRGHATDTIRVVGVDIKPYEEAAAMYLEEDSPYRSIGTTRGMPRKRFRIGESIDLAAAMPQTDWEEQEP